MKLYRDWCPPDWVDYEARVTRAVYEAGIPSPAPGDVVEVRGRRGLIYERLEGMSMLQDLNARPWTLLRHARALADLHLSVHRRTAKGLPSYKDRLHRDLAEIEPMPEAAKNKILALLAAPPDGDSVCHGDFHPGNVLITPRGPVAIDWVTASIGSPWVDVARTSLLLSIGAKAAGKQLSSFLRAAIRVFYHAYLSRYCAQQTGREELDRWTPVVAAARLSENIAPERQALIELVKDGLGNGSIG